MLVLVGRGGVVVVGQDSGGDQSGQGSGGEQGAASSESQGAEPSYSNNDVLNAPPSLEQKAAQKEVESAVSALSKARKSFPWIPKNPIPSGFSDHCHESSPHLDAPARISSGSP